MSLSPPTILQLEVTKNCNFACIMCHKGQSVAEGKDFVRTDLSELALRQVEPVYPYLRHAMLFGDGEPMVYKHFWDIVAKIRQASPKCSIEFINNGSMMHEKNRNNLFQHRVSALGLSIGGATAKSHNCTRPPGMFDKIVDNYKKLYEEKQARNILEPYITVLMVVMKSNYQEIPELIDLCHHLGIYQVSLQKLFVTHPMVDDEVIEDHHVEPYICKAAEIAKGYKIGFNHYPLDSGGVYDSNVTVRNPEDLIFQKQYQPVGNAGYCLYQQPWNTVYVLHDGKVVPDCHWWASKREIDFNACGVLNEKTNILDIWRGPIYEEIRSRISEGKILPQCRGCGLAGGVKQEYRCSDTDHTSPNQEQQLDKQPVELNIKVGDESKKNNVKDNTDVLLLTTFGQVGAEPLYRLLMLDDRFFGLGHGEKRLFARLFGPANRRCQVPDEVEDKIQGLEPKDAFKKVVPKGKIYVEKFIHPFDLNTDLSVKIIVVKRKNIFNHFANYKVQFNKTVYEFSKALQRYELEGKKHPDALEVYFEDVLQDPASALSRISKWLGMSSKTVELSKWNVANKFKNGNIHNQIDGEEKTFLSIISKSPKPIFFAPTPPPRFLVSLHSYSTPSNYSLLHVVEWPNIVKTVKVPRRKASGLFWHNDVLLVACYNEIARYNRSLKEIHPISNPMFTDLHGVTVHLGEIYTASTTLDTIIKVNWAGDLTGHWWISEEEGVGPDPNKDYTKLHKGDSPFWKVHVNDMFRHGDDLFISTLKEGKYRLNIKTNTLSLISKHCGHDLKLYGNCLYSMSTSGILESIDVISNKASRYKISGLKDLWHRGLLKFGDDMICGGSVMPTTTDSPVIYWIREGKVKETMSIPEEWENTAIHDLIWYPL